MSGEPINPERFKLGTLCVRAHDWDGTGLSLRYAKPKGGCVICARETATERQKERRRRDPDFNTKQAAYMRERRARLGRTSRSKHGLPYTPMGDAETRMMRASVKQAGRLPSVARLVYDQQQEHWRNHPDDRAQYLREYGLRHHRWRYMTDLGFRLYHRGKSKKRKAQERGSRTVMLSPEQLWRRWVEFDHRCAYCGASGDLQVEHVMPISQGGEHHLGNIVPACQRCNYSKATAPVKDWYAAQPFFSETRWLAILEALDRGLPDAEQLPLL
jgi:5-methylcytosine-specific restriction endonuclease McrA